jgi:hypothetical protein
MITSDVVLTHYDPNLPVRLACDASPYGLVHVHNKLHCLAKMNTFQCLLGAY